MTRGAIFSAKDLASSAPQSFLAWHFCRKVEEPHVGIAAVNVHTDHEPERILHESHATAQLKEKPTTSRDTVGLTMGGARKRATADL